MNKRLTALILITASLLCSCGSSESSSEHEYFSSKRALESSSRSDSSSSSGNESSTNDTAQKVWAGFDEVFPTLEESSRSAKNYAHNKEVWERIGIQGTLIEQGQDTEPVNELYLGNYKFGYNGCEVIACYNMLTLLGQQVDMARLITEFENNILIAQDGSLGSDPRKIYMLLDYMGISYEKPSTLAECDEALKNGRSLIFSFYTGTPYFSGIHTVCITTDTSGDKYVLNRYNTIDSRSMIDSVSDLTDNEKCLIAAYAVETKEGLI